MRLVQADLADIPGNRRLCDAAPGPRERIHQLVLRAHAPPRDDARDQCLPLVLLEGPSLAAHKARISMQASDPTFGSYCFAVPLNAMLRKLMWTGLYGALAAGATMAA